MTRCRITVSAKTLVLVLSLLASSPAGCKGAAIPRLTSPDLALSAPAPLLAPRQAYPTDAGRAPSGVHVARRAAYTLD